MPFSIFIPAYSNTFTLINMKLTYFLFARMESSGKPEQVHISQETSSFLGDAYYLEEGEEVFGKQSKRNSHLMQCNANASISLSVSVSVSASI